MARYRKKPVVISAWKWEGNTNLDAAKFCVDNNLPKFHIGARKGMCGLIIPTPEGDHVATKGDFIIRGVSGEYYPCKPDIFEKTYDLAEQDEVCGG